MVNRNASGFITLCYLMVVALMRGAYAEEADCDSHNFHVKLAKLLKEHPECVPSCKGTWEQYNDKCATDITESKFDFLEFIKEKSDRDQCNTRIDSLEQEVANCQMRCEDWNDRANDFKVCKNTNADNEVEDDHSEQKKFEFERHWIDKVGCNIQGKQFDENNDACKSSRIQVKFEDEGEEHKVDYLLLGKTCKSKCTDGGDNYACAEPDQLVGGCKNECSNQNRQKYIAKELDGADECALTCKEVWQNKSKSCSGHDLWAPMHYLSNHSNTKCKAISTTYGNCEMPCDDFDGRTSDYKVCKKKNNQDELVEDHDENKLFEFKNLWFDKTACSLKNRRVDETDEACHSYRFRVNEDESLMFGKTCKAKCDKGQTGEYRCTEPGQVAHGGCTSCADGYFSATGNISECKAQKQCEAGQYIIRNGNVTNDRICAACPSGTFTDGPNLNECTKHTDCKLGQYIISNGNVTNDRVCAACPSGTFTDDPNLNACTKHNDCKLGQYITTNASSTNDRKCASCPVIHAPHTATRNAYKCEKHPCDSGKHNCTTQGNARCEQLVLQASSYYGDYHCVCDPRIHTEGFNRDKPKSPCILNQNWIGPLINVSANVSTGVPIHPCLGDCEKSGNLQNIVRAGDCFDWDLWFKNETDKCLKHCDVHTKSLIRNVVEKKWGHTDCCQRSFKSESSCKTDKRCMWNSFKNPHMSRPTSQYKDDHGECMLQHRWNALVEEPAAFGLTSCPGDNCNNRLPANCTEARAMLFKNGCASKCAWKHRSEALYATCKERLPNSIPPSNAFEKINGNCDVLGNCVTSLNYEGGGNHGVYASIENCTVNVKRAGLLYSYGTFDTDYSDKLKIGNLSYSGRTGPHEVAVMSGTSIKWYSNHNAEFSGTSRGWKICLECPKDKQNTGSWSDEANSYLHYNTSSIIPRMHLGTIIGYNTMNIGAYTVGQCVDCPPFTRSDPTRRNTCKPYYCRSDSCGTNGNCEEKSGGFKCICKKGWTGDTCKEDVDECANGNVTEAITKNLWDDNYFCHYEATCVNTIMNATTKRGYYCKCINGFEGDGYERGSGCRVICGPGQTYSFEANKCYCNAGYGMNSSNHCIECKNPKYNNEVSDAPCATTTCPVGQGFTWHNSTHASCSACPSGQFSDSNTTGQCRQHTSCNSSQYEFAGPTTSSDRMCRANVCSCANGLARTGAYCTNHGSNQCASCMKGHFLENKTCSLCEAGEFQGMNNFAGQSCTKCQTAKYSDQKGAHVCTLCPAGKHANYEEGANQSSENAACLECVKGFVQDQMGQQSCNRCDDDYYQDSTGQTSCKQHSGDCNKNEVETRQPTYTEDRECTNPADANHHSTEQQKTDACIKVLKRYRHDLNCGDSKQKCTSSLAPSDRAECRRVKDIYRDASCCAKVATSPRKDCEVEWGACSATCGGGKKRYTVKQIAINGGAPCPPDEEKPCSTQACPTNLVGF